MMTRVLLCLGLAVLLVGCRSREVEKDLKITDVRTGWYDMGIVDGQNKLVPSITFRLENVSSEPISRVFINAVFRRVGETEVWSAPWAQGIGHDDLAPGAKGDELVFRSDRGYVGPESRLQMLQNSAFVDAQVQILGRHGSRNWVKIGDYTIDRQLLTP